ncbi:MAG: hypothetical protein JJU06_05820 [Ectothiorhodospiraceae bacterium]|nr:hypothetical protein [Ectothiorhodospiraceae bacterium]MCH8502907.1 hypothetical protein [Ectothiorhodospiraceae bacterium]
MRPLIHTGRGAPEDQVWWDPDGREWVTVFWGDVVSRRGAIQSSEWILPDGWSVEDTRQDVTAEDAQGETYSHCNQALLDTDADTGRHLLTNRVTFADGTKLDRGLQVWVQNL